MRVLLRLRSLLIRLAILGTVTGCSSSGTTRVPVGAPPPPVVAAAGRRLNITDFRDHLEGGWVMEMAGYAWGAATEFRYKGQIIPDASVPAWQPSLVNGAFSDDNFYGQGPYFGALAEQGPFATLAAFGERFAALDGQLWHANAAGRENLRNGIAAPASGHYANNPHADDIDWLCCGSGFIGLLTPGQSEAAVDLAFRAGHVVGYGDGVYPGVVASVMVSSAYFAHSVEQIVDAGRLAAPSGTKTREILDDVVRWQAAHPDDWTETWNRLHENWETGKEKGHCPDGKTDPAFDIDAWLHLGYDVMGLLYGQGDVEQSMRIAMRAGQDSDCTTHTVGEVLGTWLGFARIDDRWKSGLDPSTMLAGTAYSYDDVIQRSVETARAILMARGGQVESPGTADEVWILPADAVAAPLREQWPASPNPTPVIQAEAHAIGGGVVSFAASAQDDDGVSEYEWYFGDLSHQKGATAMHTYASSGSYEAIVFAADDSGNGSALTVPVSVP